MFSLNDRVVLVTGAAGLLGRRMVGEIVAAGADVVALGRSDASLAELRAGLGVYADRCHTLACDVTAGDAAETVARFVEGRFGALHGLVNNAYAGTVGVLSAITRADFEKAASYNLVAPFEFTVALKSLLVAGAQSTRKTSSVVNISSMYGVVSPDPSIYGDTGENNPVHYGATKAGLIQMTRYLAVHLGKDGIRANAITPGPFPGPDADPAFRERLAAKVPMGRVGRPEEITGPVVFLLSEASEFVNGANLAVDGGWTAW